MEEKLTDRNETSTKTIAQLKNLKFLIEKYQRGYRWGIQEVVDLLNDISEYSLQRNTESSFAKFYCLQPLVVKTSNDYKELIDGQQRATTLYIILTALGLPNYYSVSYATRGSKVGGKNGFLDGISEYKYSDKLTINFQDYSVTDDQIFNNWKQLCTQNAFIQNTVDNFYFYRAYQIAKAYLENLETGLIENFTDTLLNHTRVIWYEKILKEEDESVASSFLKFNDGKISLEQAELIKALFVLDINKEKDITRQNYELNKFAEEWNEIEHKLQNDKFWYFVSNKKYRNEEANRINLLFEIKKGRGKKDDYLHAYRIYNFEFKKEEDKPKWSEVGDLYSRLEEWFEKRKIYHLVGAIINLGLKTIDELYSEFTKIENKKKFIRKLQEILQNEFFENTWDFKEKYKLDFLRYGDHNSNITNLLILFNISVTELQDPFDRFPFNRLKNVNTWTLEHILAQNVVDFEDLEDIKVYRNDLREMLFQMFENEKEDSVGKEKEDSVYIKLDDLDKYIEKQNLVTCNVLLKEITKELSDVFRLHEIENICLLDNVSNIKVGNSLFKRKRNIILGFDEGLELEEDAYIPLTTKLLFQKSFSKSENITQMLYWSEKDREDYRFALTTKTKEFLS